MIPCLKGKLIISLINFLRLKHLHNVISIFSLITSCYNSFVFVLKLRFISLFCFVSSFPYFVPKIFLDSFIDCIFDSVIFMSPLFVISYFSLLVSSFPFLFSVIVILTSSICVFNWFKQKCYLKLMHCQLKFKCVHKKFKAIQIKVASRKQIRTCSIQCLLL